MGRFFILLQHLIPQHALSRLVALLAACRLAPVRRPFIAWFISHYGVDLSEAVVEDPTAFSNFNEFFTRALKPGMRPLAGDGYTLASPADGFISAVGAIRDDRLLQAKGNYYSLTDLLGGVGDRAEPFRDGSFATVYLSPSDYHRVHMPLGGTLVETTYVPGRLFSVNQATAEGISGLFTRNERLVCYFETAAGPMAVILVGAMIVAGIETAWSGRACPNRHGLLQTDYRSHAPPIQIARGGEMGRFYLGSTVILLFGPGAVALDDNLQPGESIRQGESLGVLCRAPQD